MMACNLLQRHAMARNVLPMTNTAHTLGPLYATITQYVVTCPCGMLPLADAAHDTAQACWNAAAKHVALNARCASTVQTTRHHVDLRVA